MEAPQGRPTASEEGLTAVQYGVMASAIIGVVLVAKAILSTAIIELISSIGVS